MFTKVCISPAAMRNKFNLFHYSDAPTSLWLEGSDTPPHKPPSFRMTPWMGLYFPWG